MWAVEENLKTATTGGLQTAEARFWLFVSGTQKEAVMERKREQRLKGEKWKGTPEQGRVGVRLEQPLLN